MIDHYERRRIAELIAGRAVGPVDDRVYQGGAIELAAGCSLVFSDYQNGRYIRREGLDARAREIVEGIVDQVFAEIDAAEAVERIRRKPLEVRA